MRLIVTIKIKIRIISHSIFQLRVLQGGLRLDLLHLQQPAFNHSNHFFHSTQRSPEQTEEDEATSTHSIMNKANFLGILLLLISTVSFRRVNLLGRKRIITCLSSSFSQGKSILNYLPYEMDVLMLLSHQYESTNCLFLCR